MTRDKKKDLIIPVPDNFEQKMIAANLNECSNSIRSYEAELEKHKNIKSGLHDDLLIGRVRVPEIIMEGDAGA